MVSYSSVIPIECTDGDMTIVNGSLMMYSRGEWVEVSGDNNDPDPFVEMEKFELEKEKDQDLRNRYPVLQEAYDDYLLIKKIVEDAPLDGVMKHMHKGNDKT